MPSRRKKTTTPKAITKRKRLLWPPGPEKRPKNVAEEMGKTIRGLFSLPEDHEWEYMKKRPKPRSTGPDEDDPDDSR